MNLNSASTPNSGLASAYEEKTPLTARLFFYAITSSLAGFLFGFDTVVISGAEQTIQKVWHLSAGMQGIALGSALYGTILGSLGGGWPSDKFGRKLTLLLIGILFIISAVGCGFAPDVYTFIVARFIGGVGIGISTVAAPLYISEISPARQRGRLTALFQFNIVFGIIVAYGSNYLIRGIHNDWRWMLGVAAFPSLIYTVLCFTLPESPRWLLTRKGDRAEGVRVLGLINPQAPRDELEAEATAITKAAAAAVVTDNASGFFSWRLRMPIMIAFLVAFFNQMSGINAVLYFAPRLLEMTGKSAADALAQSVWIGVTNLIFTFVGLALIDRLGRKTLLIIGSLGYITSLGLCAWAFFGQHFAYITYFIFAFIAAHAVGQGTVIWVLISEIFPNRYRAAGTSLGCGTHWVFAALVTTYFATALEKLGVINDKGTVINSANAGYIFAFFCGMMVLQLLWAIIQVPETKGVPLEDIQRKLGISAA